MMDAKTKRYLLIGSIILILVGLSVGLISWKKGQVVPESFFEKPGNSEACEELADENKVLFENADLEPRKISSSQKEKSDGYLLHRNITSTVFWIGEKASDDNDDISNSPSAWDEAWKKHYGGVDSPTKRKGFLPDKFCPKENPFYAALPYNDFGRNGEHKLEIFSLVPWVKNKNIPKNHSVLKNRWIKISHEGKNAFAQWEDVGPFEEDDEGYVFGSAEPKSKENKNAGIDVSPAVRDYLGLSDIDKVDWQFVDSGDVPDGAWKKIITTSQVYWR